MWQTVPKHQRDRWEANIGHRCNEDSWLEGRAKEQKLEAMTTQIVERLKSYQGETHGWQGVNLYRPLTDGTLHLVDTVDDICHEILAIKHQVFLPTVARSERTALTKEFLKWMETHVHTRYYVVTAGKRCKINELKARFKWLHTQLAEFRRLLKERGEFNGIEVVLRCDEFTIQREHYTESLTFHPHMNLAIHFPYVLGSAKFLKFKELIDSHFGTMVKDCGEIRDAKELIKYVTKYESDKKPVPPGQKPKLGLLDLKDCELAALYEVRKGLKPVQALGDFRKFRSGLRENSQKIASKFCQDGQWRLQIVPKNVAKPLRPSGDAVPGNNILVAITEAQPRFTPVLRPVLVVRNFNGDFAALRKNLNLHTLRTFVIETTDKRTIADAARSDVPPSWVHTFTETLEENLVMTPSVVVDLWTGKAVPQSVEHDPPESYA